MKIDLRKWCTWLFSVLAVLAVFSVMIVPANAAMIDYNDYVTEVQPDGVNDVVTVKIPASMAYIRVFEITDDGKYVQVAAGHGSVSYDFKDNVTYRVTMFPFGNRDGKNGLLLKYMPAGTVLYSGFGFDYSGDWNLVDRPVIKVRYYQLQQGSAAELNVSSHNLSYSQGWDDFSDSYTVNPVENAELLCMEFYGEQFTFTDNTISSVYAHDTVISFAVSSDREPPLTAIGIFFNQSVAWMVDVLAVVTGNPALLVLCIAMPIIVFAVVLMIRLSRL